MRHIGRPKTAAPKFMDGFYLEVKGANGNVRVKRDSMADLIKAVAEYVKSKKVIVLGELRDGHWMSKPREVAHS
jgi:hypothetical protein